MIPVYCEAPDALARAVPELHARRFSAFAMCRDWSAFSRLTVAAGLGLLVALGLRSARSTAARLRSTRRVGDRTVLVASHRDPDVVRTFATVPLADVCWVESGFAEVERTIERVQRDPLALLVSRIDEAVWAPHDVRLVLRHLFFSNPPPRTVTELGQACQMARTSLWRVFRRASPQDVQLQHLVDLTVLTRAVALYGTQGKWAPVGERLGLHPYSLGRVARRITGRSLPEVAAAGPAPLVRL